MSTNGPTPSFSNEEKKRYYDLIMKIQNKEISFQQLPPILGSRDQFDKFKVFYNAVRRKAELAKERKAFETKLQELAQQKAELQQETAASQARIANYCQTIQTMEARSKALNEEREKLSNEIKMLSDKEEMLSAKEEKLSGDINALDQKRDALVHYRDGLKAENVKHNANIQAARHQAQTEITRTLSNRKRS